MPWMTPRESRRRHNRNREKWSWKDHLDVVVPLAIIGGIFAFGLLTTMVLQLSHQRPVGGGFAFQGGESAAGTKKW